MNVIRSALRPVKGRVRGDPADVLPCAAAGSRVVSAAGCPVPARAGGAGWPSVAGRYSQGGAQSRRLRPEGARADGACRAEPPGRYGASAAPGRAAQPANTARAQGDARPRGAAAALHCGWADAGLRRDASDPQSAGCGAARTAAAAAENRRPAGKAKRCAEAAGAGQADR